MALPGPGAAEGSRPGSDSGSPWGSGPPQDSPVQDSPARDHGSGAPSARDARPGSWRRPIIASALLAAGGGIALGAAWVVFGRLLAGWVSALEGPGAHDVAFALLAVLAGVITAGVLALRPGDRPGLQVGLVLVAVSVASLLAWGVGRLLGAPALHAVAMVVVWPLVTAALTTVRSLISVLLGPS
jgi:hypothetical protein